MLTAAHCFHNAARRRASRRRTCGPRSARSRLADVPRGRAGAGRADRRPSRLRSVEPGQRHRFGPAGADRRAADRGNPSAAGARRAAPRRPCSASAASTRAGSPPMRSLSSGAPAAQVSDRLRQAAVRDDRARGLRGAARRTCGARPRASQLCAAAGARETCVGDSGAPLIVEERRRRPGRRDRQLRLGLRHGAAGHRLYAGLALMRTGSPTTLAGR